MCILSFALNGHTMRLQEMQHRQKGRSVIGDDTRQDGLLLLRLDLTLGPSFLGSRASWSEENPPLSIGSSALEVPFYSMPSKVLSKCFPILPSFRNCLHHPKYTFLNCLQTASCPQVSSSNPVIVDGFNSFRKNMPYLGESSTTE